MHSSLEAILVTTAVLLLLAILASKAAVRLGVPALLLFLCLGMLAGSEGIGGIEFDYPHLAQSVGIVALVFILFSAALDTKWDQIRPVLGSGVSLATLGVVISSVLLALFAMQFAGLRFRGGLLLGAVVSSTDAAAVFTVLRSKNLTLKGRLREVAELESGSNDPMAVLLTIGILSLVADPSRSIWSLISTLPSATRRWCCTWLLLWSGDAVADQSNPSRMGGLIPCPERCAHTEGLLNSICS